MRRYPPLILLPTICFACCVLVTAAALAVGMVAFDDTAIQTIDVAPRPLKVSARDLPQLASIAVACVLGVADDRRCPLFSGDKQTAQPTTEAERKRAEHLSLLAFTFYLANYTVIVYFNVALSHIALSRLVGGNAGLTDGLRVALSRIVAIIQWALLAATVGMLLKAIRDRSWIGEWISSYLGYAWKLATYFVMPLLALRNVSPGEALHSSADLFAEKWIEIIAARFSFSLLFCVLATPAVAFTIFHSLLGQTFGFSAVVAIVYFWFLSTIIFATEQVFIAAVYLFLAEGKVAKGFSKADFMTAWGFTR